MSLYDLITILQYHPVKIFHPNEHKYMFFFFFFILEIPLSHERTQFKPLKKLKFLFFKILIVD